MFGLPELYAQWQQQIATFLTSNTGMNLCFALLIILRIACLATKAWGFPYSYTSYMSLGGRSPQARRNSSPTTLHEPRLIIYKTW